MCCFLLFFVLGGGHPGREFQIYTWFNNLLAPITYELEPRTIQQLASCWGHRPTENEEDFWGAIFAGHPENEPETVRNTFDIEYSM